MMDRAVREILDMSILQITDNLCENERVSATRVWIAGALIGGFDPRQQSGLLEIVTAQVPLWLNFFERQEPGRPGSERS